MWRVSGLLINNLEALLLPIFAVFARFLPLLLLILLSALFLLLLLKFFKQKPLLTPGKNRNPDQVMQENGIIATSSSSNDAGQEAVISASPPPASSPVRAETSATLLPKEQTVEENGQDLYSESESIDQFSSTSTDDDDDDHSSDTEWRYNSKAGRGRQAALDCSDDSILSDEEGLIEIAIPTGQFVSPDKLLDPQLMNLTCCKQLSDHHPGKDPMFVHQRDLILAEMNEEDNLIEIDIYMGSIKLS
ncbi:hypothetical protein Sango_2506600 [Sesamum angolense]|uniref:Uncharacterized protein n=1 Tax=Sesamum angolense TaxID=2727404 RepID=A0AAE2BI98_9LAMI|nr:hypothetical protein Sango_2506600 [Sesamum angolense]